VTDLIRKLNAWDKAIQSSNQGEWRDEAKDCFAMVAGDQVNEEDKRAAEDKGILYAILNKIDPTVSAICGSEITNRQEVRYYPRQSTIESAQVNEILTAAAEWSRDECDANDEESEAFRDSVICGMGWTETRMSYDVDPDGMPITERVDPIEMAWDPSARRPNLADARYKRRKKRFSKDEAAERFGIDPEIYGSGRDKDGSDRSPHDADPENAYQGKGEPELRKDELEITEYQWYQLEPKVRVANPVTGELEELTPDEYERMAPMLLQVGGQEGVPFKARCYYRAYRIADEIIEGPEKLPEDEFTLKCVTGKLDRNKAIWYGVVRAMRDPQRLLNKQVTQLQRIIDVNAKGGLLAESSAFEDPEQAKSDWAASDSIVFTKDGAVSKGAVIPKPVNQYPSAIDKMLGLTMELVPGVSGVNNEMLGLIDREQAGVVDWQRKQAAYGVLAGFFNSLRRYRRMQGRHLLKLITKYMSDGRLIRIQGKNGDIRYAQLAKQDDTLKYDVIVDEAPAGPNQKERTFMFLTQFGPTLAKMGLPPQIWLKMMEYSPLPSSLVAEVQQIMQEAQQNAGPSPEQLEAQVAAQKAQADLAKVQGDMQKLAIENEWVKLEMQKSQMEGIASQQEAQIRARETAMREQNDTLRMQLDRDIAERDSQIKALELQIKARELELKEAELGIKAEMEREKMAHASAMRSADHAAASNGAEQERNGKDRSSDAVGMGLQALAEALSRPKKVIRGEDGRAMGIE
jgi:hypothetical protein